MSPGNGAAPGRGTGGDAGENQGVGLGVHVTDPYVETRDFVRRVFAGSSRDLADSVPVPAAGSPEWVALPDDSAAKLLAVLTAGTLAVLTQQLDAIEDRRRAAKAAAVEVSEAAEWQKVANAIRERDQWMKCNPWAKRVVSS